jgi:CHAD domain-containing protein
LASTRADGQSRISKAILSGRSSSSDVPLRNVREAFIGQLDNAERGFRRKNISDESIHRIRQELKRARATLRLLRPSIGAIAYHRENLAVRDVARPLTPVRDARVLLHTLTLANRGRDGAQLKALCRELRRLLLQECREGRKELRREPMLAAAETLRNAARRAETFAHMLPNRLALDGGLGRVFKSGKKSLARVRRDPADANLHEWRKQVQYLFNQLDVLHRLGVLGLRSRRERARRLADILGSDHDLAVLSQKIAEFSERGLLASGLATIRKERARTKRRRSELQLKALRLGRRLYSISAKRFKAKLQRTGARKTSAP